MDNTAAFSAWIDSVLYLFTTAYISVQKPYPPPSTQQYFSSSRDMIYNIFFWCILLVNIVRPIGHIWPFYNPIYLIPSFFPLTHFSSPPHFYPHPPNIITRYFPQKLGRAYLPVHNRSPPDPTVIGSSWEVCGLVRYCSPVLVNQCRCLSAPRLPWPPEQNTTIFNPNYKGMTKITMRILIRIQITESCSRSSWNIDTVVNNKNCILYCLFPTHFASWFMRIRIKETNLLRIRADPDPKQGYVCKLLWSGSGLHVQIRICN